MVFGIIHRHGGTIEIASELGKGTSFTLRLPVSAVECTAESAAVAPVQPLHVLVVDDLPILCQLVCEYLQDDLHTVEIAASGSEALELFRGGEFDLVITDHIMAGMNGHQLAVAIKALKPGVPIILLTAYADHTEAENKCPEAVDLVLAKPLSRSALRHALAHVTAL